MSLMVDPPSGWKYGFPKAWNKETYPSLIEFLTKNGYPMRLILSLGSSFHVRMWDEDKCPVHDE